jgi:hypothetical protein
VYGGVEAPQRALAIQVLFRTQAVKQLLLLCRRWFIVGHAAGLTMMAGDITIGHGATATAEVPIVQREKQF